MGRRARSDLTWRGRRWSQEREGGGGAAAGFFFLAGAGAGAASGVAGAGGDASTRAGPVAALAAGARSFALGLLAASVRAGRRRGRVTVRATGSSRRAGRGNGGEAARRGWAAG